VKIDLPKLLLELRAEVVESKAREGRDRLEKLAFRMWAWVMRHPRLYEMAGMTAATVLPQPGGKSWISGLPGFLNVGPAKAWAAGRDLPPPAEKSFRQLWRDRASRAAGAGEEK
jgi:L-lactate dehydrogenase complex protein LldF